MNWYVHKTNVTITDEMDHCEHLKEGDKAPYCTEEKDSFGMVGIYCCCQECHDRYQEDETEYCHDCGQEKPLKEITEWRWYDFYAPQGDEPLCICDECRNKEKHVERRRKDREEYEREMDYLDELDARAIDYEYDDYPDYDED